MDKVTREDVLEAFAHNRRQRNRLLYLCYLPWFQDSFTAGYIARKISADLGIAITHNMIRHIRSRIHKPLSASAIQDEQVLKQAMKQQILLSLNQGQSGNVPTLVSAQNTHAENRSVERENQVVLDGVNPDNDPVGNADAPPVDPSFDMDELEDFLKKSSLPLGDLQSALESESSPAKRILLIEKIKQTRHIEAYNNSRSRSIFD